MYKLKNLDNTNNGYQVTITDQDYSNLVFYKKWKYEYFSQIKTNYVTKNNIVTPISNNDYYQQNNNSNNLLTNILLADVLLNDSNNNTTNVDDPNKFQGFAGGDFGGAGSEGSWTPNVDTNNVNDTLSNDNPFPAPSDTTNNDQTYIDNAISLDLNQNFS